MSNDGRQGKSSIHIGATEFSRIEMHSYSELMLEVGGFLVGTADATGTHITASIPALKAESKQISLTFTHDVWEDALNTVSREHPGLSIVGWYHTHPSFGVFLSEYDAFIQRNFFSAPGHVALVIDPIAGTFGWFSGFNKSKEPRIVHEGRTVSGPVPREKAVPSSRPSLPVLVALITGSAVLSALVTWGLTNDGDWRSRAVQIEKVQNQTWSALTSGVILYRVSETDTFETIEDRFYPEGQTPDALWQINGWEIGTTPTLIPNTYIYLVYLEGLVVPDWQAVLAINELLAQLNAPMPPADVTPTPTPSDVVSPSPTPSSSEGDTD
jgi:proteasome lid subunit RPN8/RPN11